jgi:hypothetical protein
VCPRLHYRLLTLCPAPTDPVPRGLLTLWARAGMRARVRSAMPFAYLFVRARERTHTHTHTHAKLVSVSNLSGSAEMTKADVRRLVYGLVSQGCSDAVAVAIQANPDLMRPDLLRTLRPSFLGLKRFCSSSLPSAAGRVTRRFACSSCFACSSGPRRRRHLNACGAGHALADECDAS